MLHIWYSISEFYHVVLENMAGELTIIFGVCVLQVATD